MLYIILSLLLLSNLGPVNLALGEDMSFVQVSPRDPRYFELSHGRPYIAIGFNLVGPPRNEDLEAIVQKMAENKVNYCRVWLASRDWNIEHQNSGEYDNEKAKIIDKFLNLARENGIRVKMCLEYFRDIAPEGTSNFFNNPLHHISKGGQFKDIPDFLESEKGREQFKGKLRWYAQRYGDDPAVFAWELWNEMDCIKNGDWFSWTEIMLKELHSLFPKNLAVQSLGSYDNVSKRDRYNKFCHISGNDVAQVHRYLDLGAKWEVCHGPMDILAADAVRELIAFEVKKPIILTETGAVKPSHTGCSELYAKDKDGMLLHDILFAPFFAGAAGTGHGWFWQQSIDTPNLWYHFARFAEAINGIDPPSENFTPIMISHPGLRVYALKGKNTSIIWCRDSQNDWRTELEQGIPPEVLNDVSLDLSDLKSSKAVKTYNPWKDVWEECEVKDSKIILPQFSRSIVVKVIHNGEK
ncbi:glycoside hydrolase family 5 protein [Candidatus Poribacteria bacterium]|nr:glycoside hydrolase family 5 protein [Candidatus Poribacteria bacterium]